VKSARSKRGDGKRGRRIVGVDVGGTQMTLAVADEHAALLAHVRAQGHNLALEGADTVADAVARLLEHVGSAARPPLDALVVGAAGAANPELARSLKQALARRVRARALHVDNDVALLMHLAAPGSSAVVLSVGTGAVAFARTRRGVLHRIDGWGPLAGDRGSGHYIGLRALDAALSGHDGRARRPRFAGAVLRALRLSRPERDIAAFYANPPSQRDLAALAPFVVRAARRGDPVARGIIADAAAALEHTVRAACARAGRGPTELFVTGGLGRACPELLGNVIAFARQHDLELVDVPPAEAASLALGFRLAGVVAPPAAMAELTARTTREARAVKAPARRRSSLPHTEAENPATTRFSSESARTMVALMNAEDARVAPAVRAILPDVARAVERIEARLRRGGRLVYAGAGTSGRLGFLDASEIPPTFGTEPDRVVAVIAGGPKALTRAVEGAEDDAADGANQMRRLRIGTRDAVVGLSVSGGAPFVLGAMAEAQRRRALTVAVSSSPGSPLARAVDLALVVDVGPEVIAGSSRLKAGSAQKMILNMLSTCTMARLGLVTGNLMTRVVPSNKKLRDRAVRVAAAVLQIPQSDAQQRLEAAGYDLERALSGRKTRRR
jgi:N-acetylmuramic acid 6-phosphate etherase